MTSTATGISASGDVSNVVPDHLNIGFRRRELVYENSDNAELASTYAKVDSTTTWNNGFAISQTGATGRAAELIATKGDPEKVSKAEEKSSRGKPLLFSTSTRFGLSLDLPVSEGNRSSFVLGYKRKVATIVRKHKDGTLPSTLSEVSLHGTPFTPDENIEHGSIPEDRQLSKKPGEGDQEGKMVHLGDGGVRIHQRFAVGSAADALLEKKTTKVQKSAKPALVDELAKKLQK